GLVHITHADTEVVGVGGGGGGAVLATHGQGTPVVAGQAQPGLTAEQLVVALSQVAVAEVAAGVEVEDGTQAVAQVLGTTDTPAVAVEHAVTTQAGVGVLDHNTVLVVLDVRITIAGIQDTVHRDGRFCLSNAGKADDQSSSEQSLFHVRYLRRLSQSEQPNNYQCCCSC